MAKRRNKHQQQNARSVSFKTVTRKRIITYGIIVAIISGVGIAGYKSMIPTNSNTPVFGIPVNHFVKAKYSTGTGYAWVSMSSSSSKGLKSTSRGEGAAAAAATVNPSYVLGKGGLQSMHVINEDYETHSKHNFNIDEFNVHSNDLTYTQSQTLTFVADKSGTFHYYCSIHPEMKGDIIVK
jgi:plastocyanin